MRNKYIYLVGLLMMSLVFQTTRAAAMRDPTEPPDGGAISQSSDRFMLNSILVSSQRTLAVINGEIVGVGDQVNDAKVVKIAENQVVLLQHDKRVTLYLVQEKIRQD